MSDALPLPPKPALHDFDERARQLARLGKSGDLEALRAWAAEWIESLVKLYDLDVTLPRTRHHAYTPAEIAHRTNGTVRRIAKRLSAGCTLARARQAIAAEHGFSSWSTFARHVVALNDPESEIAIFERAVDAIVNGDLATLQQLLTENPGLARKRSSREHRSTLLHYVSANGVEDYRQKTPPNIVEITRLLLDAGADVNAESQAYGGRSTTLGLTATSCHPEEAGVQLALMDVLIDRGALIDGPDGGSAVNGCLHNGRGEAAEYFASRGAKLDLEGAAGVGRLDVVKSFFDDDGNLIPPATLQQLNAGFTWACEFGRTEVIEYLLQKVKSDAKLENDGLHWAGYGGNADIVRLLLTHGFPVDVRDKHHDGTPLGWALYGWGSDEKAGRYYEVVALLAQAGARLDPEWYEGDPDRQRAAEKLHSDPIMMAALAGKMTRP